MLNRLGRLIDWLIDWLIFGRLIDWLNDWLNDWLIDRLIEFSVDWLIDWLGDRLCGFSVVSCGYFFKINSIIIFNDFVIFSRRFRLGLLSLYIQDNFVAFRIAGAILMPMLQVAALHFYIISDFRQCIPLPMLYVLIPAVLAALTWKHIAPMVTGCGPRRAHVEKHHHRRRTSPPRDRENHVRFDYADFHWNYLDNPLMR